MIFILSCFRYPTQEAAEFDPEQNNGVPKFKEGLPTNYFEAFRLKLNQLNTKNYKLQVPTWREHESAT